MEYSTAANLFVQTVQMIVQSYSINNVPHPKALSKFSEVCIQGSLPNEWHEDVMSIEIWASLTSLPSVKSILGKLLNIGLVCLVIRASCICGVLYPT